MFVFFPGELISNLVTIETILEPSKLKKEESFYIFTHIHIHKRGKLEQTFIHKFQRKVQLAKEKNTWTFTYRNTANTLASLTAIITAPTLEHQGCSLLCGKQRSTIMQ